MITANPAMPWRLVVVSKCGTLRHNVGHQEVFRRHGQEDGMPIVEANARLIAAAPDLLSACEAIASGMHQSGGPVPYFLQNAIAKAKGDTP